MDLGANQEGEAGDLLNYRYILNVNKIELGGAG